MKIFEIMQGDGPIILGQPHGGTHVPDALFARLNDNGQELSDTDWHIANLYQDLLPGVSIVRSNIHRYVIDANRDPDGASLYPGQNTTSLCPLTDFDGKPIWGEGQEPSDDEINSRRETFHAPYHRALGEQIERLKARHDHVIFYDCHSIRSKIPFLFQGLLPVFNIGTDNGQTCHPAIEQAANDICTGAENYDVVCNGRFRGGWSTRHYADPKNGVHAIQMELSQRAYMTEAAPWNYRADLADGLRPVLTDILQSLEKLARSGRLVP